MSARPLMLLSFPEIIKNLKQYCDRDWLIGCDRQLFWQLTHESLTQILEIKQKRSPLPAILIAEANPWKFLAFFLASVAAQTQVFLGNPHWKQQEWQQVFTLVKPDLILGDDYLVLTPNDRISNKNSCLPQQNSLIMIPTGGSSGKIRFAIHTWSSLTASVSGFCQHFTTNKVNSFCILPLYHVSGLMQFMRSFLTSGKLAIIPYSELKQGKQIQLDPADFFISLVPTQLQFLLQSQPNWLSNFQTILLGGAPPWQSLLDKARQYQLPLAPTYGMTETASQIVTLKPQDFLRGNNSSGRVLPHARVTILNEKGNLQDKHKIGSIAIVAESLYLGYYGNSAQSLPRSSAKLVTDDLGFFDPQGYLHIVGRRSQKIITGGENVFPAEVEAAILATGLVTDVCVIGLSDRTWGQAVTAVYIPIDANIAEPKIKAKIVDKLSKYKLPKYWIKVDRLPRNQQGKIDYQKVQAIGSSKLLS